MLESISNSSYLRMPDIPGQKGSEETSPKESDRCGSPNCTEGITDPSFRLSIKQIDSTAETPSLSEQIAGALEDLYGDNPSMSALDAIDWLRLVAVSDLSGEIKDQVAQGLIGALPHLNPDLQIAALDILAALAGTNISTDNKSQIINLFIACLIDENLEIELIAAESLAEMHDPQVTAENIVQTAAVFIRALGEGNRSQKSGAENALTKLIQSNLALDTQLRIVGQVFLTMANPDETLRAGARKALEIITAAETSPELNTSIAENLLSALEIDNDYLGGEIEDILHDLPESFSEDFCELMAEPLVRALGNDQEWIRSVAEDALGHLLEADLATVKITEFLLAALNNWNLSDQAPTYNSIYTLLEGIVNDATDTDTGVTIYGLLVENLNHGNNLTRLTIIEKILLNSDSIPEAAKAALVLATLHSLQGTGPYEGTDRELRDEAVQLLGELAESNLPEADKAPMVEPLVQLLGDLSPEVRDHSFWALFALIESNVSEEFKLNLVKLTAGNLDVLLSSIDPEQFNDALQYLKMLLEPPELFADSTNIILGEVFAALGDANLREGVFRALENIIQSTPLTQIRNLIIEHIMDALENPSWREGAIRVLQPLLDSFPANLKPELVGSLIKCLKDQNTNVQANAARALGVLAGSGISVDLQKSMVTPLIEALQAGGNSYLKLNVAWALGVLAQSRISPEDKNSMVGPLVSALGNEDQNVRSKLATTLAILVESDLSLEQKEQMIDLVVEALQAEGPNLREGAALALVRLAEANVPPELKAEVVRHAIEVLDNEASRGRANAAWVLGGLARLDIPLELKNSMVDPLLNAINSADHSVQANAALAAGSLAESNLSVWSKSRFVEVLITNLSSPHSDVRIAAALALGLFAGSNIPASKKALMVEPLIKALKDEDPAVQLQAVQAVLALALSDISADLKTSLFKPLLDILAERSLSLRPFAIKALAALALSDIPQELKEKMVEPLILALQDEDLTVRSSAVWALARLAQSNISIDLKEQMIAPLLQALADSEVAVRSDATWALAKLAGADISPELKTGLIEPLLAALREREPSVQINAAQALAALAASNVPAVNKISLIDGLIAALSDSDFNVRSGAAAALAELAKSDLPLENKDQLVEPLLEALKNEDFSTRFYAMEALKALVESALPADRKAALIDPLIAALEDNNRSVRSGAAGLLARLTELDLPLDQKDRIVTLITGALQSNNEGMHLGAATALAVLAGADCPVELKSEMGTPLIRALSDDNPDVQRAAVWALIVLGQSNASLLDSLIPLLEDRYLKASAMKILLALSVSNLPAELKIKIVEPLLNAIGDRTSESSHDLNQALIALAELDLPAELKIRLESVLSGFLASNLPAGLNEGAIFQTLSTLGPGILDNFSADLPVEIKNQMVEPLLRALDQEDITLQSEAARVLMVLAASDISTDLKARIADQFNKLWNYDEISRTRAESQGLYESGNGFFVNGQYENAEQALVQSESYQVFLPTLIHICRAVSQSPSEYLINEVTLNGGLTVRSFIRRDGSEEEVHVFYEGTTVRTVMTGKTTLSWQNEDRETIELTLGLEPKDLTDLNDTQMNLRTLFPGTFGVVTFEDINSDIAVEPSWAAVLFYGIESPSATIYHTLEANNLLLELISRERDRLPEQIYFGLNYTVISAKSSDERNRALGDYQANSEIITLSVDGITQETLVHELVHHWDMSATQAEWFSGNLRETDLSSIYRGISWNSQQDTRLTDDQNDFRGGTQRGCSERMAQTCQNGPLDSDFDIMRQYHPYGMENPREDMATFGADYYNSGWPLRMYVRDQMRAGNFEPAAKYLFIRYFLYLGQEYGLSFEGSLGYSEIMEAMENFGLENIPSTTRNAIYEVLRLHPWIQE